MELRPRKSRRIIQPTLATSAVEVGVVRLPVLPDTVAIHELFTHARFSSEVEIWSAFKHVSVLYDELSTCRSYANYHADENVCRLTHSHFTWTDISKASLRGYVLDCVTRLHRVDLIRLRLKRTALICLGLRRLERLVWGTELRLPRELFQYIVNLACELRDLQLPFYIHTGLLTPNQQAKRAVKQVRYLN
jgi:hypothetical protein